MIMLESTSASLSLLLSDLFRNDCLLFSETVHFHWSPDNTYFMTKKQTESWNSWLLSKNWVLVLYSPFIFSQLCKDTSTLACKILHLILSNSANTSISAPNWNERLTLTTQNGKVCQTWMQADYSCKRFLPRAATAASKPSSSSPGISLFQLRLGGLEPVGETTERRQ